MAEVTPRAGHPPSSWSDIPWDLAGLVLRLLPAYADRARFAAVCPQWRATARQLALPPPLPLLALPDGTFYSLPYGKPFRFPGFGCAGFKSAACGSWLIFPRDDGCYLVDPFAHATVALPPLSRVRLRPPNAVAKFVDHGNGTRIDYPYTTWMHIKDQADVPTLNKLILCSPNLVAAFVGNGRTSQILMCQPGASSWSVRAYEECKMFEDMSFYQGKLYAITVDENLLVVNISQDPSTGDPQVSRVGQVIKGDPWYPVFYANKTTDEKKLYLVESHGTLLMVRRKVWCILLEDGTVMALPGQNEFEVFQADLEHSRWVNVTTLGDDQVIFLGRRCSRAVSASQYGMSGDQIFFLDDVMENALDYFFDGESTSVGVYDMRTSEISSPLPMVWMHEMIHATWLFPRD
ncbi:hypothetical protein BAE44_0017403 [Dichanthelium oligosanthes]|uniref:KIB1-4 beta-propeller domain-containing protein n=1 Tax=Dichanthelium oligosanthes TaxID=888268 RepID=A0A1E5V941_9POAL|nr:hypothetical protein BAE44_0017403 [Dichanthelium oligosanthes]